MGEPSRSRHKTHLIAWRIAGGTSAPASLVTQGLGTTRAFHYTIYTVTVTGMLGPGTVTASLAAGVAHDAAGNGNFASAAATVTYDHTPLFADADVEDAVHDALQLPQGIFVHGTDAVGNLVARSNPDGGVIACAYDAVYRRIGLTMPEGGTWQWTYDRRGRTVSETDPLGQQTTLRRDAVDLVLAQTNPDGSWIHNTYDDRLRLVRRDRSDGSFDRYEYDLNGNTTVAENGHSRVTLTYDALGRRQTETTTISGDTFVPAVSYQYDAAGRLDSLTDQSGGSIDYTFDTAGRLVGLTSTDGLAATVAYDGFGQRALVTSGNGRSDGYYYEPTGEIGRIEFSGPAGPSWIDYLRDAAGNPTTVGEAITGMPATLNITYDSMGRPTAVNALGNAARSELFSYDRDGNMLTTAPFVPGSVDAADQLLRAPGSDLLYDAQGNLDQCIDQSNGARTESLHDPSNRLIGIRQYDSSGGLVRQVDYVYDALGRRIKIADGDTATYHVFAFDNVIATVQRDGVHPEQTTHYLVGPGMDDVFGATVNGAVRYLHRDALGSVRLVSDASGSVVAMQAYSLFGRTVAVTGTNDTGLGFTARPADPVTGMIDLRARSYDPALGRFDARDPNSTLAEGGSLYAYAGNHPLRAVDPTGYCAENAYGRWSQSQMVTYAQLANAAYAGVPAPGGWTAAKSIDDSGTGFHATLFLSETGQAVLAFRGTDQGSVLQGVQDWYTNVTNAVIGISPQYVEAAEVATWAKRQYGDSLTIVGHSKGGGQAQFAGLVTGTPTVAFNGAGLSPPEFVALGLRGKMTTSNQALITHVNNKNDVLTGLANSGGMNVGTTYPVDSGDQDPIQAHSMDAVLRGLNAASRRP
jgi:RHS repeat-associated protein